jgi:hypothetical protein
VTILPKKQKNHPMKKLGIASLTCAVAAGVMATAGTAGAQTLALELQAANYNPITGVWTDTSGNGNNATWGPANGGTPAIPTLATGATPNGSSAVDITATGGNFAFTGISGASGYTIFAYIAPTADTGGGRFAITGGNVQSLEYDLYQGHQNWLNEYIGNGGPATSTVPTGSFSLLDLAVSGAGGAFNINETPDGTTGAGSFSTGISRIGNNHGGGDSLLGDIAEIDIYTGVLSPAQIATQEGVLTADYVSPVPEPTTWAMLIGGFGTLVASRRFRRQA